MLPVGAASPAPLAASFGASRCRNRQRTERQITVDASTTAFMTPPTRRRKRQSEAPPGRQHQLGQWVIHYVFQNGVRGIHTKSTDPEFLGNEIQKFENKNYCSLCSIRNLFLDSNHFHKPGYSLLLTSFLYFLSYSPLLAFSLIRKQCPNDKHNYNGMYRI